MEKTLTLHNEINLLRKEIGAKKLEPVIALSSSSDKFKNKVDRFNQLVSRLNPDRQKKSRK